MRWSNLSLVEQERARLPGYRDEAVVRHFDAPDAVRTTFYEVRAKSILNKVPQASRMPFRWTINPYRGCTHSCVFCLSGDTPVLLSDGTQKPIEDLVVGEEIYGTVYDGKDRRYVRTTVVDRWTTVKPAFRVVLADGTELITSGDHRFLSNRGWKFVTNTVDAPDRPHLTPNDSMRGRGQLADPPVEAGQIVTAFASLTVAAIEPLGVELPMYDITTGTGDFIANGVVSHTASPAQRTRISTSTPAGTSSGRSSSRSMRLSWCGPSWHGHRGVGSTWRSARTRTRTSGSRAATG